MNTPVQSVQGWLPIQYLAAQAWHFSKLLYSLTWTCLTSQFIPIFTSLKPGPEQNVFLIFSLLYITLSINQTEKHFRTYSRFTQRGCLVSQVWRMEGTGDYFTIQISSHDSYRMSSSILPIFSEFFSVSCHWLTNCLPSQSQSCWRPQFDNYYQWWRELLAVFLTISPTKNSPACTF